MGHACRGSITHTGDSRVSLKSVIGIFDNMPSSLLRNQTGNRQATCVHSSENLVRTGEVLLRTCNICKDAIFGVGTCLKCNGCNYYFHEICLGPQPTLQHSFYPAVNFNFSGGQGIAGQRCVACYQHIQGCLYVGNNAIYIHPFCLVNLRASASYSTMDYHKKQMARLLETYDSNGGGVAKRLEVTCQKSLSPEVKCIFCKQKDTETRGFGWAYKHTYTVGRISTNFECHVACLRAKLNQYCKNQIFDKHPGTTYDQRTYFLELRRSKLEDSARGVAGFALPVAIAGLDLMISAFVGAPLVSLSLSFFLGIGGDQVERMLRRPRGN
ncbi:PHD domain-containing protein [Heracleum sosnowskyi]|uniref:PHD domain-containing protein n=1 Tax=Heracleum sosnowskyi TaxID=360622 RepID=A0AAD8JJK7_9APIA|nr:PHD domain-containing protein [Heracleum sosnowskyi]